MSVNAAVLVALVLALSAPVQDRPANPPVEHACDIDLERVGQMNDILSNALMRGLDAEEDRVREFLEQAQHGCANGRELLVKTAREFGLSEAALTAEVERFRHVNCKPGTATGVVDGAAADPVLATPLSRFAQDVTLHVVLHELGHALVREFDLPVLGNEETMADAFATHYLTAHLPERALDALVARVSSLQHQADAVPREEWSVRGEHDSDARRACQIAALAVAADPQRYRPVATAAGLSDEDVRRATDYGSEIHRSWRRILQPLWMPAGLASPEKWGVEVRRRLEATKGALASYEAILQLVLAASITPRDTRDSVEEAIRAKIRELRERLK